MRNQNAKIDGIRKDSNDPARQAWYAAQRQRRYARFLLSLGQRTNDLEDYRVAVRVAADVYAKARRHDGHPSSAPHLVYQGFMCARFLRVQ